MESTRRHSTLPAGVNLTIREGHEEVVSAAIAGSHAAFGELQKIYSRRLYKRILPITRSHEDAEDTLQETFLRAYLALPSFQGRSSFSTWLTRIAINSALMTVRKRRSRPEMFVDQQHGLDEDAPLFDIRDKSLNPEQFCDQKQQFCAILSAVRGLDPKLRAPLRVLIEEKRSMKELAHHLRISEASVKARLHRARKRLRGPFNFQRQSQADSISRSKNSASYNLG